MEFHPEFKDNYGNPYQYAKPYGNVTPTAFYGIVWELEKKTGKIHIVMSDRPYKTSAPARQWCNRYKERNSYWRDHFTWLQSNIINTQTWELVD